MLTTDKISKYDKVRITKSHHEIDKDGTDTSIFVGQVGTVVAIDKWGDGKYPYEVEFADEDIQDLNEKYGTFLWEREQLEFWFDIEKMPIGLADLQGENKTNQTKVYHEPKKVATINKNDLVYLSDSIESNIKRLHSQQNAVEAVLYSLVTLKDNIEKRMKEMEE